MQLHFEVIARLNASEQFWYSNDLFSLLLSHFTVYEGYSIFPCVSKWHNKYLQSNVNNVRFLREWMKKNLMIPVIMSELNDELDENCQSLKYILDIIFNALDDSHKQYDSQMFLSLILNYLFDYSLPEPDFEIPEMYAVVCHIKAFQKLSMEKTFNFVCEIEQLPDPPNEYRCFLIEVIGSGALFDPHGKLDDTLRQKAIRQLPVGYLSPLSDLQKKNSVIALESTLHTARSSQTKVQCIKALFSLLNSVKSDSFLHRRILDSDLFCYVTRLVEQHTCDEYLPELALSYAIHSRNPTVKVSTGNLKQMLRLWVSLLHFSTDTTDFDDLILGLYGMVKNHVTDRIGIFVESGILELIQYQIRNRESVYSKFKLDKFIIKLNECVFKYGNIDHFNRVQRLFPVIPSLERFLKSETSDSVVRGDIIGVTVPILIDHSHVFLSEFCKSKFLLEQIIAIGYKAISFSHHLLLSNVLRCIEEILYVGRKEHMDKLIRHGAFAMLVGCVRHISKCSELFLSCICRLLSAIENYEYYTQESGSKSSGRDGFLIVDSDTDDDDDDSKNDSESSKEKKKSPKKIAKLTYAKARDVCELKGISEWVYDYCFERAQPVNYSQKSYPVDATLFPGITKHFPKTKPLVIG